MITTTYTITEIYFDNNQNKCITIHLTIMERMHWITDIRHINRAIKCHYKTATYLLNNFTDTIQLTMPFNIMDSTANGSEMSSCKAKWCNMTKCSYFQWSADNDSSNDFNFEAALIVCLQQTAPLWHLTTQHFLQHSPLLAISLIRNCLNNFSLYYWCSY